MGIQVGFKLQDVEHLVQTIETSEYDCEHCFACCEDGMGCTAPVVYKSVLVGDFEGGIWCHLDGDYVWVDANHWGKNREIIIPLLQRNNIEYVEG